MQSSASTIEIQKGMATRGRRCSASSSSSIGSQHLCSAASPLDQVSSLSHEGEVQQATQSHEEKFPEIVQNCGTIQNVQNLRENASDNRLGRLKSRRSRVGCFCSLLFGGKLGVPRWMPREVLLALYMFSAMLTACVYFGFPAIRRMLLESGAYEWLCDNVENIADEKISENGAQREALCDAQDAAVAPLFTVAMVSHSLMSAVAGTLLDHVGPKFTALIGQGLNVLGWALLAFSSRLFPAYIPAVVCIGLGADTCYLPLLKIVNLFGRRSGTVISLLGVACTASFGVPMILEIIWTSHPHWSFSHICAFYVILGPGICIPIALFLIPWKEFPEQNERTGAGIRVEGQKSPSPSSASTSGSGLPISIVTTPQTENHHSNDATLNIQLTAPSGELVCATSGIVAVSTQTGKCDICEGRSPASTTACSDCRFISPSIEEPPPSFASEVFSVRFLCIPIFASSQQLAVAFFQVASQRLLAGPVSDKMDQFLSLAFIPCVLIGTAIDYFGIFPVLFVMNSFGVLAYVFCLGPSSVALHFMSLVFFCGYVSLDSELVFCCVNKMFSQRNFGKLSGIAQATGGLTSLISIPLYNNISVNMYGGDCHPVTWAIAVMLVCVFPLVVLVWWLTPGHGKRNRRPPATLIEICTGSSDDNTPETGDGESIQTISPRCRNSDLSQ